VAFAGQPGAVTIATNMAGRGTDIKLGAGVREKGGLFILGTERHESRRIDRQLRGRSGRQGDPGTTIFFLSLEDDLLRLFGSERAAAIMSRAGFEEGEVIKHPIITKSVERAQKKVEENNFAIRKRLLEYDNTMNQQRTIIYSRRNRALHGERLRTEILEMMEDYVADLVEKYYEDAEVEQLEKDLQTHLLIDMKFDRSEWGLLNKTGLAERIIKVAQEQYDHKEQILSSEMMARIERFAFLTVIDNRWKEHLRDMDDLKEGINLRAYGQKDPLIEYKNEAFDLFTRLLEEIRNETVQIAFKLYPAQPENVQITRRPERRPQRAVKESADNAGMHGGYVPSPKNRKLRR
jgi:protein translocase subunit secA